MTLGLSISTFTLLHVVLSLIGICAGIIVAYGLLAAKRFNRWTMLFFVTTILTSLTGFGFPFDHLMPSHIVGIISLVALAIAVIARYALHLAGAGRWMYVMGAMLALYLNVFVLIVQSFEKVPALKDLAPTQSEPPFLVAQLATLALFIVLSVLGVKKFRTQPASAA